MQLVASEHATLVENLRTAFQGESNAHARYVEFAERADGEGWQGVASLFRAAARAEQIHAANHGRILRQLDGEVSTFASGPVDVKGTLDNLRTALAGEIFEIDTMYPAYLDQARHSRDVAVVRTLTWALEAEKTHARLFNEALTLLEIEEEEAWITMARDFYVCPVCGHTSEVPFETEMCPACLCASTRFEHIR